MRFRDVAYSVMLLTAAACRPAWSHAILMDSSPKLGGEEPAGPQPIVLRYNSLVDAKRSRLVLIGPDAAETRLPLTGGGYGDTLHATALLRSGHNRLRWQVLAIDGHITRGDVPFDVILGSTAASH